MNRRMNAMSLLVKPNFFIIGAPKCGTTALSTYLGERKDVFFCDPKEPGYWCADLPGLRTRTGVDSLERYLELFYGADPNQHLVVGEGSTHYFRSVEAVQAILNFQPSAKFLLMLRNPVNVVYGCFGQLRLSNQENLSDFREAWRLIDERAQGRQIPPGCASHLNLMYNEFGLYAESLARFNQLVPPSKRMVVLFEDLRANAKQVYQEVTRFLDLPDDQRSSFAVVLPYSENRLQFLRNRIKVTATGGAQWTKPIQALIKKTIPLHVRQKMLLLSRKRKKRPPLDPAFRTELADYFCEDILRTSKLLNRDLTHWLP